MSLIDLRVVCVAGAGAGFFDPLGGKGMAICSGVLSCVFVWHLPFSAVGSNGCCSTCTCSSST